MALEDWLGIGGAAAGIALADKGYSELGDIGERAFREFSGGGSYIDSSGNTVAPTTGLAKELEERLQFQPYTVTTATGSDFGMMRQDDTTLDDGTVVPGDMEYKLNLSPDEQAFYENRLAGAGGMFDAAQVGTADREKEVFERMMAAIRPERERESDRLQQQLQAQGRLGVETSMFGGTPEGLALAKAQEEAYSQNMLSAMTFAGQEQQRQAQLGSGMLAAGYMPQQQLVGALQPGMTGAEQRRQATSQQTGAYGETYAAGLQALLSSALGQAGIAGGIGTSMASAALGGLFEK
jgi:hypothetical protein